MKFKFKKSFTTVIMATIILGTSFYGRPVHSVSMPSVIYETTNKENIASGVTHENILKFTTAGWWNINVIRVDLTNEYVDIQGLFNENGIPNRGKVSKLVDDSKAVAGVNGDFFNYNPMPSAMGTLINKGEIISSPIERAYALPSLIIDSLNNVKIDYMDRNVKVQNLTQNKMVNVNTVNKVTKNFDTTTMLNSNWGSKSIGNKFHKDLIEVVVVNDLVTDVRLGLPATEIPKDGYVLAVRGERTQGLESFQIGDEIKTTFATSPDLSNIDFAIGGGSVILRDGKVVNTNINIAGSQPRTAIGVSQDGKELLLVTIDGRGNSYKGVSQETFGQIIKDIGGHNVLNLDGGGSTVMVVKPNDEDKVKIVNTPSDGGERAVINAVGVFSDAPIEELSYIKLIPSHKNLLLNTSASFKIKAYDVHHNPVDVDSSLVSYSLSGVEGSVNGNRVKVNSSGEATIKATYDGRITDEVKIKVLGPVKDLESSVKNINVSANSEKALPNFIGRDEHGTEATVYPEDIAFGVVNNIGSVENGIFKSGPNSGSGALTARLGDGVFNILVSVGSQGSLLDPLNTISNVKSSSYPTSVPSNISLSSESKDSMGSISMVYDFTTSDATRASYMNFIPEKIITGNPSKLGLWVRGDNNNGWLRANIKDKSGNTITLDFAKAINWDDWKYVTADIPSNTQFPISLTNIYIAETNAANKYSGEVLFDSLMAEYPPKAENLNLPAESSIKDNLYKDAKVIGNGYSIGVAFEPKGKDELVTPSIISGVQGKFNNHTVSVFMDGASGEFQKGIKTQSRINANTVYSRDKYKDTTFVNINSNKGGIRVSNSKQWPAIKQAFEGVDTNNLIVFLNSPVFGNNGFNDKLEANLFHDMLVSVRESGKNVFVVYNNGHTVTDLKDGVRYIGLRNGSVNSQEDIKKLSILEFIINDNNVSYHIKPIFK